MREKPEFMDPISFSGKTFTVEDSIVMVTSSDCMASWIWPRSSQFVLSCHLFNAQATPDCSEMALIYAADVLGRVAAVEEGLAFLLYGENTSSSKEERYVP